MGMRAHGVITGIHEYGVFVSFYNDCSGLAPVDELDLEPGQRPSEVYSTGQVCCKPLSLTLHTRQALVTTLQACCRPAHMASVVQPQH